MNEISKNELMRGLLTQAELGEESASKSGLSGLITVYKAWGKTPLETLEELRQKNPSLKDVPLSYAGRLDPLAEGLMLVLVGETNKDREKYLGLDKTYEVEILFGVKTDTGDLFGVPTLDVKSDILSDAQDNLTKDQINSLSKNLNDFVGKQQFPYPIYSSKTVEGKPLFQWAIEGKISDIEIPKTDVEVYSIKILGDAPVTEIKGADILEKVDKALNEVKGDFRYEEIRKGWNDVLSDKLTQDFYIIKIECVCSSGTYMRVLAEEIGKKINVPALAYSIKRTKIADVGLDAAMG